MIGINDPFNNADGDPFNNQNDRENNDWQERQRRQRTIRLMLMFIMMLILMDGEEAEHRRNSKNRTSLLRKNIKKSSSSNHVVRPEALFDARRSMDRRIEAVSLLGEGNHRIKNLLKLNGEKNEEAPVIDWAVKQLKEEKNNESRKSTDKAKSHKKEDTETREDAEAKRSVYHYPYNTTGYYRGVWKVKREPQENYFAIDEKKSQNEIVVVTSSLAEKNFVEDALSKGEFSSHINVITQEEVNDRVADKIFTMDKRIGLFIMPKLMRILSVDLVNFFQSNLESEKNQNYTETILEFLDVSNQLKKNTPNPTLSLKEDNGRAAFQLFSRPIPGMTQISLVDGFVKLFDGEVGPFTSKKDVLLRVQGVAIHKIGKLSLVSNAGFGRSGMLILDKKKDTPKPVDLKSKQNNKRSMKRDKKSNSHKKRRLSELVNTLPSSHHVALRDSDHDTIDEIRQSVISSYRNYWSEEYVGGHAWSDLYSSGMEFDIDQDDFFTNNYEDMTLFSKASNLFDIRRVMKNLEWFFHFGNSVPIETYSSDIHENTYEVNSFLHSNLKHSFLNDDTSASENSGVVWKKRTGNQRERNLKQVFANKDEDDKEHVLKSSIEKKSENEEPKKDDEIQNILRQEWMNFRTNTIFSFPYVPDDPKRTLRESTQTAKRSIPSREDMYIDNAKDCEFEINLDIRAEKRTVGEWRKSVLRQMKKLKEVNPHFHPPPQINGTNTDSHDQNNPENRSIRSTASSNMESELTRTKSSNIEKNEVMAMNMLGHIKSPNCDFVAHLNVTAIRPDWEHTTGKAINYSFFMMITCLTQIVVLLRQLLHTQAQSVATRVSLLCVGWQTVLDAMICIEHMLLCLLLQPLFTAFASVAFFKLLIFCVIEMKYMAIIIQARNNSDNVQTTVESLRRQVAFLHLKFYISLMLALVMIYFIGQHHRTLYMVLLYSFWVPQIIRNIITEAKKPLHLYYIYGMSITRLIAPTYFLAYKNNFLKGVSPEFPTDIVTVQVLYIWIAIQTAVLVGQGKYGSRFMIPAR